MNEVVRMSVWSTISPTASHTFVLTDVIAAVVDTTPAAAATATEGEGRGRTHRHRT